MSAAGEAVVVESLDRGRIEARLAARTRERLAALDVLERVGSTNDLARARVPARAGTWYACLADAQTAGRGRRGRRWVSPAGANLYLSLSGRCGGCRPSAALVAAVAVVEALQSLGVSGVGIEWPNDLVHGPAKLGGLLLETAAGALVLGLGLNLRMPVPPPGAIDRPWTDLSAVTGGTPPSRCAVAAATIDGLTEALARHALEGFGPFEARYARLDSLHGREIELHEAGGRWRGRAAGVAPSGALRVVTGSGLREVVSAEVSVRAVP